MNIYMYEYGDLSNCRQKYFYYKVESSPKRGYNRRITVFMMRKADGMPRYLGYADVQTAGYKGDKATACDVISKAFNYKKSDGYFFDRQDLQVWAV